MSIQEIPNGMQYTTVGKTLDVTVARRYQTPGTPSVSPPPKELRQVGIKGSGFRVQDSEFRIHGLGLLGLGGFGNGYFTFAVGTLGTALAMNQRWLVSP